MSVDITRLQDQAQDGDEQAATILATIAQRTGDDKLSLFLEGVRKHQLKESRRKVDFWDSFSTGSLYVIRITSVGSPPTIALVKNLVLIMQAETGVGWHLVGAKLCVDRMLSQKVPLIVPVLFSKRKNAQTQLDLVIQAIEDVRGRQGHIWGEVVAFSEESRNSILAYHRALFELRGEKYVETGEVPDPSPKDGWGWDLWRDEKF